MGSALHSWFGSEFTAALFRIKFTTGFDSLRVGLGLSCSRLEIWALMRFHSSLCFPATKLGYVYLSFKACRASVWVITKFSSYSIIVPGFLHPRRSSCPALDSLNLWMVTLEYHDKISVSSPARFPVSLHQVLPCSGERPHMPQRQPLLSFSALLSDFCLQPLCAWWKGSWARPRGWCRLALWLGVLGFLNISQYAATQS